MSLSFDLYIKEEYDATGVFYQRWGDGEPIEITYEEWNKAFPSEYEPVGRCRKVKEKYMFAFNITHNLGTMADACGIYTALWRPDENGYTYAKDIIKILEDGFQELQSNPEKYRPFSAKNGWGTYEQFLPQVKAVLDACKEYPDAIIRVSR